MVGGRGNDTITAGDGSDVLLGDSGEMTADLSVPGPATTWLTIASSATNDGGDDNITTGSGNDIVIGGFGNDTITADDGDSILLGDNGEIDYTAGVLTNVASTADGDGGDDTIQTGVGTTSFSAAPARTGSPRATATRWCSATTRRSTTTR